ncbi:MAG: tyrosine-type recombinase/integrase [Lysinibacillus sp.]
MASIKKRGDTYYFAVSNYVDGKSRPIRKGGFKTKKAAEMAAAEIELSLAKGTYVQKNKSSLADYFNTWVETYKSNNVTAMTLKHYTYTHNLIIEYFKDKPLTNITRKDYQEFLNHIGQNRAKETVAKVNMHIKSCVEDAMEDRVVAVDFTRKTNLVWKNEAKKKEEKYLNQKEYDVLLNEVYERLERSKVYYILLIALTTGMRFGEIVGLTIDDFDFNTNKVNVTKTWGYKPGSTFGFGPLKNDASERKIKIDKTTADCIKRYINKMEPNEYRLLFYSEESKYKCISNSAANDLLRDITHDLRIERITLHGLRHTHASSLLYKKASIYYVSERLGHKNINTTLSEYTHVMKELREDDEQLATNLIENMYVQSNVQSENDNV